MSFGCSSTNSTTSSRMSSTELAVDATIDRAGMPSGELGSLSEGRQRKEKRVCEKNRESERYRESVRLK